jgi:tetratricopeptide (TPR) repeat protein
MPKQSNSKAKLSRRQIRDLDIEIDFLEGLVRRDPTYVDAVRLLAQDYALRGRFEDSLRLGQRLVVLQPDDPMSFYQLACGYALNRQIHEAALALAAAIERGYRDFDRLATDPLLENLRRHPMFRQAASKIRSLTRRTR